MSTVENEMKEYNAQSIASRLGTEQEHLAEKERLRLAADVASETSIQGTWRRIIAKRNTQKVLLKFPITFQQQ